MVAALLVMSGCMTTNNMMYVYDSDNSTITQPVTTNQNKPVTPSTTLSIPASLLGL
jgi:hypothetical protein